MTTKRFAYARPDGGVNIVIPAPASRLPGEEERDWLARVVRHEACAINPQNQDERDDAYRQRIKDEVAKRILIDARDLPDRAKRNAWVIDAGKVEIDQTRLHLVPVNLGL